MKNFTMPSHFSNHLKDLITKMLEKDPKKRITAVEAMEHPWFQNVHLNPDVDEE